MVVIFEDRHEKRRLRESRIDGAIAVILSFFSLFLIIGRLFIFTPYQVSGTSMNPTLGDGDKVVVTDDKEYKQGDIIVFQSPVKENTDYVKRVIGVAGDTVTIQEGKVQVNGEEVYNEEEFGTTDSYRETDFLETYVPKGHVYVLGDNRENSMDSRIFGTIDKKLIKGKLFCRLMPVKDFYCDL